MLVDFILHAALAIGALQMLIDLFACCFCLRDFADAYRFILHAVPAIGYAGAHCFIWHTALATGVL